MQETKISWANWTWNPTKGCSEVSPGCKNCYAKKFAARFSLPTAAGKTGMFAGFATFNVLNNGKRQANWTHKVELDEKRLRQPFHWRAKARKFLAEHGYRPRVFVNSMSDLFHEELPIREIDRVMATIIACPEMDFLALTKREEVLQWYFHNGYMQPSSWTRAVYWADKHAGCKVRDWGEPWSNLWVGVSVEDRKRLARIDPLRGVPAAVRFLSIEPLLEDLGDVDLTGIDWVIVGGESGPGARPFFHDWAMNLKRQAKEAGCRFFMKQYGSKPFMHACRNLECTSPDCEPIPMAMKNRKGEDMTEWPADIRLREVPEAKEV